MDRPKLVLTGPPVTSQESGLFLLFEAIPDQVALDFSKTGVYVTLSFPFSGINPKRQLLGHLGGAMFNFIRNRRAAFQGRSDQCLKQYLVKPNPVVKLEL